MNRSVLILALLVVALLGWIGSGMLTGDGAVAPAVTSRTAPVLVEARRQEARPVTRFLLLQGEVRPNREVDLRAEAAGKVAEVAVERGARVEAGALVVRLELDELLAGREEARAQLTRREADYEAASRLGERGITPETRVREAFAQLQAARAALARIEREIEDTTIEAPFSGIVNALLVEAGEFVASNGEVATLIENDPLIVMVNVPQQSINEVRVGAPASVTFVTGRTAEGRITFVSANASRETRTFRVDVQVPNPDSQTPSGISAEVRVPVETVSAHFLSPALLSLGTDGALGIKTVDDANIVRFYPVDIVRAQADGIWVSGLPNQIRLITTGQGFVRQGERVAVAEAEPEATPAAASENVVPPQEPGTVPRVETTASLAAAPAQVREPPGRAGTSATVQAPEVPAEVDRSPQQESEQAAGAASEAGRQADPVSGTRVAIDVAQRALNAAGFEAGPVDGIAGPQTVEAIRSAQQRFGLPATGIPTGELLRRLSARTATESRP